MLVETLGNDHKIALSANVIHNTSPWDNRETRQSVSAAGARLRSRCSPQHNGHQLQRPSYLLLRFSLATRNQKRETSFVTPDAIAEQLVPYLGADRLSAERLGQLATYLDLLLRWNARTNLTSVRKPEDIVSRHFGESLFAARQLFPSSQQPMADSQRPYSGHWPPATGHSCADLGSGAGFPGLPLKIWAPGLRVTLIESQNKKTTFLREVVRALQLKDVEVFSGRGEDVDRRFDLVTLRAVERFESALEIATGLLAPSGRLALLIGSAQVEAARNHARYLQWSEPLAVPLSDARVLFVGTNPARQEPPK